MKQINPITFTAACVALLWVWYKIVRLVMRTVRRGLLLAVGGTGLTVAGIWHWVAPHLSR